MTYYHNLAASLPERSGGQKIGAVVMKVAEVYVVLGSTQSHFLFRGCSFVLAGQKGTSSLHTSGRAMSSPNSEWQSLAHPCSSQFSDSSPALSGPLIDPLCDI